MTRTRRLAPEDALTKSEAAALAGVHWRTINRWVTEGHLTRYVSQINRFKISRRELEKFLAARRT